MTAYPQRILTPKLHQHLYLPDYAPGNQYQTSYHIEHAPWDSHDILCGEPPAHIVQLHDEITANHPTLEKHTLTDGTHSLTITPRITALQIVPQANDTYVAWVNVQHFTSDGQRLSGERFEVLLGDEFHETHGAHVAEMKVAIPVSLQHGPRKLPLR